MKDIGAYLLGMVQALEVIIREGAAITGLIRIGIALSSLSMEMT
jgi:hypothetical protein